MCYKYIVTFVTDNHCVFNETGDWSNGMIGVSKTFGGSSILSSPAKKPVNTGFFFVSNVSNVLSNVTAYRNSNLY